MWRPGAHTSSGQGPWQWRKAKIVMIIKKKHHALDYWPDVEFPNGFTLSVDPKHIRVVSDNGKTIDPEHIRAAKQSYKQVKWQ
jgi:hypothetical protein